MREYLPPRIEPSDVETFARDGAVRVKGLLNSAWVERMREAIDRVESTPGPFRERYSPDDPGEFLSDKFLWTFDPDFRAVALDSPAAEAACRLMRASRVNVFYDHLMVKEPGAISRTPWHQDLNYWPVEGEQVCSVWIAFDHVDRSNGAMEFVAGSHRSGRRYQHRARRPGRTSNARRALGVVPHRREERRRAVPAGRSERSELAAGEQLVG